MRKSDKIAVFLRWYGRCQDMTINYADEHHGTVFGETADECMRQIRELKDNNDLSKYSPIEIAYIYDI